MSILRHIPIFFFASAFAVIPAYSQEAEAPSSRPGGLTKVPSVGPEIADSVGVEHRLLDLAGGLEAVFDGRGIGVQGQRWSWGLELARYGFEGQLIELEGQAVMRAEGARVRYEWGQGLEEWCVSGPGGLEHGFTLEQRPVGQGPGEQLILDLRVLGDLVAQVESDGRDVRFLDSTGTSALDYLGLLVTDATGRELPASFSPSALGLRLSINTAEAVYPIEVDPTIQSAYIKASNTEAADFFGSAVAISGDTMVVGAWQESSNANVVNGNQLDNSASRAGAAYVFVMSGGVWTQQAYLKASNAGIEDHFGQAVAIDGDTIVVGAEKEASAAAGVNGNQADNSLIWAGAAYVFFRTGTTWSQQAYLKASSPDSSDLFGFSVAISGDLVIVGAPDEASAATGVNGLASDNSAFASGAAYLFGRLGSTWTARAYFKASNTEFGDNFGVSVAIDGNRVVIGASFEDSIATGVNGPQQNNGATNSGAVYVFEKPALIWSQVAYIKASNADAGDLFGASLSLDASTLAVGARHESSQAVGVDGDQNDNSLNYSGAAYVLVENSGTWSYQGYFKSNNPGINRLFGKHLALSGDRLVIGDSIEGGAGFGINPDPLVQTAFASGAVESFLRESGSWSQDAYIKASNSDLGDLFGIAVALDNDRLVVGASGEGSLATGVGGNQDDNSASSSGAVYVFELASTCGVTEYGSSVGVNSAKLQIFNAPKVNAKTILNLSNFNGNGLAFVFVSKAGIKLPLLGGTLLIDPGLILGGSAPLVTV